MVLRKVLVQKHFVSLLLNKVWVANHGFLKVLIKVPVQERFLHWFWGKPWFKSIVFNRFEEGSVSNTLLCIGFEQSSGSKAFGFGVEQDPSSCS